MFETIRASYKEVNRNKDGTERILRPEVEIADELWGIDAWLRPHITFLSNLRFYHHFRIARHEELENKVCDFSRDGQFQKTPIKFLTPQFCQILIFLRLVKITEIHKYT